MILACVHVHSRRGTGRRKRGAALVTGYFATRRDGPRALLYFPLLIRAALIQRVIRAGRLFPAPVLKSRTLARSRPLPPRPVTWRHRGAS